MRPAFLFAIALLCAGMTLGCRRSVVCGGGEVSALSTLRNIASAEEQFRSAVAADCDADGVGEFGFFAELSGACALPNRSEAQSPPVLSGAFRSVGPDGFVKRGGYCFRVFLPDARGEGIRESGGPYAPPPPMGGTCNHPIRPQWSPPAGRTRETDRVDPKLASRVWCAYAWPVEWGRYGNRTFFVGQDGHLFATDDARYTGDHGPDPGAAFTSGGLTSIAGAQQDGAVAQDGNVWKRLN